MTLRNQILGQIMESSPLESNLEILNSAKTPPGALPLPL